MKVNTIARLGLLLALTAGTPLFAQEDAEGCSDSKILSRLNGCFIEYCEAEDYDESQLEAGPVDPELGEPKWKVVEGKKTVIGYWCEGTISTLQVIRNAEIALKRNGFTPVYSGKAYGYDRVATLSKGNTWVQVGSANAAGDTTSYTVTIAEAVDMEQEMVSENAATWGSEIETNGKVAIHGITFDTGKATLTSEAEPLLQDVALLLRIQPDLKLSVEGHTDDVGTAAANQKLSEQRAAAVVAWLVEQGVDAGRLASRGHGATAPMASNDNEQGRALNRRVELVRR